MMACNRRTAIQSTLWTLLAIVWVVAGATATAAEEPAGLTAHDVAALRVVTEIAIAPDGTATAYGLSVPRTPGEDEDGPAWVELHVVGGEGSPRAFVSGEVNVSHVAWRPGAETITFLAKRGDDEHQSLYEIPINGGEARQLLSHATDIQEYSWSRNGKRVAYLAPQEKPEAREKLAEKGFKQKVFEEEWLPVQLWIATPGGEEEPRHVELPGSASEVHWSPAGDQIAVALAPTSLIDDRYMQRRVHIIDPGSGEVNAKIENPGKLGSVRWSPDGRHLALLAGADINDPSPARLMVAPVGGGTSVELMPGATGDAVDVAWLDDDTLLWIGTDGVRTTLQKIGRAGGEGTTLFAEDGPIWSALSLAGDGKAASLIGDAPDHPWEVFQWTVDGEAPQRLTDSNPWLAERELATQEVVEFTARDGLSLQGMLLRPLGVAGGERAPLVLVVHGGPEAHFSNGWLTSYSRLGQMLAAKGFAVFYPNYRGSTGRGLEFAKTSQADPAGKEFEDLIDAVDHLIEMGVADPDKVGITGGSYGGYATAWSSTFYTDRFAAGVMFVGISDMVSKLGTSDIPNELYQVHARRWPWEAWDVMLERSPLRYVEQARTPLLIMGGDADTRVHPSESLALYRYLKILGNAPVRYVVYPGEPHGNRKAAARLDYSLRALRWFEHYLQGAGGEPPAPEVDYGLAAEEDGEQDEE